MISDEVHRNRIECSYVRISIELKIYEIDNTQCYTLC